MALEVAARLAKLDAAPFAATKRAVRAPIAEAMLEVIEADLTRRGPVQR